MQKPQFLAAIRSYQRWALLSVYGLFACFWLVTFVVVPAGLRHVPETILKSQSARLVLFYAGCVALLAGLFLVQSKLLPRLARKCSLVCPSCHRPFSPRAFAELGYSGKCDKCGGQVFDREASAMPGSAPLSRIAKAQFLTAIHGYRRDIEQKSKQVAAIASIPSAVGLGIMFALPREQTGLRRMLLGVLVIGGLLAGLAYSLFAKRRAALHFGLACPSCRKPFNGQELRDLGYTDTCAKCGGHVFD